MTWSIAALGLALIAACRSEDPDAGGDGAAVLSIPTGETGTPQATADTASSTDLSNACLRTDNALRVRCDWPEAPPGAVVRLTGPTVDGVEVVRPVAAGAVSFWGLYAESDYGWQLEGPEGVVATGAVQTGPLPEGARLDTEVTGVASVPMVAMRTPCIDVPMALVLDTAGRVVWYEDLSAHLPGQIEGLSVTDDGTLLAVLGVPVGVAEVAPDGTTPLVLEAAHFANNPHHDVVRHEDLTYVLVKDKTVGGVILDGVDAFDATGGLVWSWRLADHIVPVPRPGLAEIEADYSHANSLWVDEVGDVYVSFRHLSAVMHVGGPASPDAGAVRWSMVGDPDEARLEGSVSLIDESFVRQHNVHLTATGQLAMFDNRFGPGEPSRVLWIDVEASTGRASVDQVWTLPLHCPFQGGAWTTSTGHALATCAPRQQGFELVPGQEDPVWSMTVRCEGQAGQTYIPRMIPLDRF